MFELERLSLHRRILLGYFVGAIALGTSSFAAYIAAREFGQTGSLLSLTFGAVAFVLIAVNVVLLRRLYRIWRAL